MLTIALVASKKETRHLFIAATLIPDILEARLQIFQQQDLSETASRNEDEEPIICWLNSMRKWNGRRLIRYGEESIPLNSDKTMVKRLCVIKQVVARAAVCDFLGLPAREEIQENCNTLELPIWCGPVEVSFWIPQSGHYYAERKQIFINANVIIYAWQWNPRDLLAWYNFFHNNDNTIPRQKDATATKDCIQFLTEPVYNNFVPTPPCIGRMAGLSQTDQQAVQQMSLQLQEQSYVAVLKPSKKENYVTTANKASSGPTLQSARFDSRPQAQLRSEHYQNEGQSGEANERFHRWIASDSHTQKDSEDLICCWDRIGNDVDSGDAADVLECVLALTTILKRQKHFHDSS